MQFYAVCKTLHDLNSFLRQSSGLFLNANTILYIGIKIIMKKANNLSYIINRSQFSILYYNNI